MPCLHTESLSSLPAEGQYGDTSAPKMSQRSRSNSGRKGKSGEKGARGERKDSIKEQSVITSAGWVFSPLWISGAKTQRLGFRMGMESERVKAWLDDHSDSARCYFNRSSRQWVNSCLEKAFQSPRNEPKSKMAVLGRRRVSHPVCGPSRKLVHPATLERPHSCLSVHQYDDCATLDKCGGHSPKPPGATCLPLLPRSPQASCLSRSQCFSQPVCSPRSPRLVRECRRGESCDFMMKLFGGEVGHLQSKDIHLQMLLHLCEIIEAQSCSLSMTTMDKTGGKSLGPVLQTAEESVHGHTQTEWEKCIMGYVVSTGRPLNIRNAHEDPRFQCKVDDKADDRLKSILTVPILNHKREVIGVFMAGNKRSPGTRTSSFFSEQDEKVLSSHMALFGLILENSQLSESSEQENRRNQVLLALAQVVSQDFPSVDTMLKKMAAIILPVAKAQICVVFISDDSSTGSFSSVAHIEYKETSHAVQCTIRDCDTKDISFMYAAHVQNSQETLNITNVITDQRLNRPGQTAEDSHMRSLICTPMRGKQRGTVIGLCQLVNKRKMSLTDTEVFSRADELLLEDFAVYCALGLHKLNTRQTVEKTSAKLAVTKEVLSYQISAPQDEIEALEESVIPSAESLCLLDFSFSDCNLSQTTTTQAVVRMFIDLNLLHDFNIDYKSLCQWVLSVQKGYRSDVVYHNWSHALSTAQCMFAMLNATDELKNNLSSLEVLALMIASLSHDLDHRGVNNSYIERSNQPLAQLYGHSSLEHHHYDMCLLILNNPGSQILSSLSLKEYRACVQMIERNILATDLAVYIEKRTKFFELSENGCCLWKYEEHRELLRSMLMTASDICAITKPWPVQKRIAERVATEFFAQGDREKCEFNIQPIDVMDRENSTRLPHMQVEYIDGICSPLYEALASIFASCSPLIEGCKRNRNNWQKLVDSGGDEEEENKIKGKNEKQDI